MLGCYLTIVLFKAICTAVNDGVTSRKAPEQGVLKKVKDLGIRAGGCHQWPLLWTERSHKH